MPTGASARCHGGLVQQCFTKAALPATAGQTRSGTHPKNGAGSLGAILRRRLWGCGADQDVLEQGLQFPAVVACGGMDNDGFVTARGFPLCGSRNRAL